MTHDNRQQQRSLAKTRNLDARFHVEVYDRRYVLHEVHDVSVSGAGIRIPLEIAPGTPVKLVYRNRDYAISVLGKTVWCSPVISDAAARPDRGEDFRTGIQFDARDRNCTLFFMALREFIDNYDSARQE